MKNARPWRARDGRGRDRKSQPIVWLRPRCRSLPRKANDVQLASVPIRFIWCLSGLLLLAATWLVWQRQFVAVADGGTPSSSRLAFTVLQGPGLVSWPSSTAAELRPPSTLECPLDGFRRSTHVLVSFHASSEGLSRGLRRWDMGRVVLTWRNANGMTLPGSVGLRLFEGDQPKRFIEVVMPLEFARGQPCLSLQNSGSAGVFRVEGLRVIPLVYRPWIRAVAVLLVALWLVWAAIGIRIWIGPPSAAASALAAALACLVCWFGILPGPWLPYQRIMGSPFATGIGPAGASNPQNLNDARSAAFPGDPDSPGAAPQGVPDSIPPKPSEEIDQGPVINLIRQARNTSPLFLHILAFSALTVLYHLVLCGSRRGAWLLPATLAGASELMQVLFGFGFDQRDAIHLGADALGIATGVVGWKVARECWKRVTKLRRNKPG